MEGTVTISLTDFDILRDTEQKFKQITEEIDKIANHIQLIPDENEIIIPDYIHCNIGDFFYQHKKGWQDAGLEDYTVTWEGWGSKE